MLTPISLGVRSNPERDNDDGAARLINCYVESAGEEGIAAYPVYACDGFTSFSTLTGSGAGVTKGMFNLDDTALYVVTGTRLNSVNSSGTATDLGALVTTGYAYFARNRKTPNAQVGLVTSDGLFRVISNGSVSTPSLDVDIDASLFNSICALDGYFIFTKSDGEWYISSIDEGATVDELDFSKASSDADGLLRGLIRGRDVVLFGPRSVEFWNNTGADNFPFERAGTTRIGCYAAPAACEVVAVVGGQSTDTIIWPATSTTGEYIGVMILEGYQGQKISPPALDRAIRDEPTLSSIRAFTYSNGVHAFYCITGSSFTWEFNLRSGFWHERTSTGLSQWRVVDACGFAGKTIFADYSAATLYQRSHAITPGAASTITLRHSKDGGRTFTAGRSKSIGSSGEWDKRVKWNRLGQSDEDGFVIELAITNAVMEAGTGNPMTILTPPVHASPSPLRAHALYANTVSGTSGTSGPKGIKSLAIDIDKLSA